MSFDLENLPDPVIIEFLERLPDDELLAMCDQKISKKVHRLCRENGDIRKRIKESGVGAIKAAWDMFDMNNSDPSSGTMQVVEFTGNEQFDAILTKGSQIQHSYEIYDPADRVDDYKDSLTYKLYAWGREKLADNVEFLKFKTSIVFTPFAESVDLLCAISKKEEASEVDIWLLILAFMMLDSEIVFPFFSNPAIASNLPDDLKEYYQDILDTVDGRSLEEYTEAYVERYRDDVKGAQKFLE